MKNNKKLVLTKDTVKNIKVKSDIKTGLQARTQSCQNSTVHIDTAIGC